MDARTWLRDNDYHDIADMIDEVIAEWVAAGKKTRRNWWDILAGGKNGQPRTVGSRQFPVLAAAQRRQGKKVTKNALTQNRKECAPARVEQARWKK